MHEKENLKFLNLFFFLFQSLLVLIYLVKNGSEKSVTSAREHLYDLKSLESFAYTDENGKDQGINGKKILFYSIKLSY